MGENPCIVRGLRTICMTHVCISSADALARRAAAAEAGLREVNDDELAAGPVIDPWQDLWDAMEGQEGVALSAGAKEYLQTVFVSRPQLKPYPYPYPDPPELHTSLI